MSGASPARPDLAREAACRRPRAAQLEGYVVDLTAENRRLHARRTATPPNPLGLRR